MVVGDTNQWSRSEPDTDADGWWTPDGEFVHDVQVASFPPLQQAERRIAVLEHALRSACADGWADSEGAMAGYLREAEADAHPPP